MTTNGNNLELNKGDQFIIGYDISGSMGATDCPGGLSRFNYVKETVQTFVREAEKWDPDGVSFYPFGATVHAFPDLKSSEIDVKIGGLKMEGATMTHLAIRRAYEEHKAKKNEQTFLMVFTDGEPSDKDAVRSTITDIANSIADEKEFRIAFLTVGNRSAELDAYLTSLDDDLAGAKHDIVDVKRLEDVDFMAAVNGAMND